MNKVKIRLLLLIKNLLVIKPVRLDEIIVIYRLAVVFAKYLLNQIGR